MMEQRQTVEPIGQNGLDYLLINPSICQLIFDKRANNIKCNEDSLFNKSCWVN